MRRPPVPALFRAVTISGISVALAALPLAGVTAAPAAPTADGVAVGPVAAPVARAAAASITLTRTSGSRVVTGTKASFKGVTPKALRGKRVSLYRKVSGESRWLKVSSARVSGKRTFTVSGTTSGSGRNQWKVTGRSGSRSYSSGVAKVTVLEWFHLYDLDAVTYEGVGPASAVAVGGRAMARSVAGWTDYTGDIDYGEWNLGYKCDRFAASIGIDDRADTGHTAEFLYALDGQETSLGAKSLGPATAISIDLRSRLRLKLTSINQNSAEGYDVWGNARILCSQEP